ncbi:MAG: prepilin-type N-terminal cleavage/methylation domain-containing protein [Desulfatibacillaceae bacterium]
MRGKTQSRAAGFTLIEVLVAMFIFSLVVGLLFGAYSGILASVEGTNKLVRRYEGVKNCMERIQLDLDSVQVRPKTTYTPPDFDDPPDPWRLVAERENVQGLDFTRLRFASLAHVNLTDDDTSGGIAEIVYYVTPDPAGKGFVLRRRDTLFAPLFEEIDEDYRLDPILVEGVRDVSFKFLNDADEWVDEWDSDADSYEHATPKAVAVMVEIGGPTTGRGEGDRFETAVRLPLVREPEE